MSRPPVSPTGDVRARRTRRDVEVTKKRGPGTWVYVGTFPTDPFTTYWSPSWENGWGYDTERVAFRWSAHYRLELKGRFDSTGATTGTVAFTLPEEWRPSEAFSYLTDLDYGDGTFSAARIHVATSGAVTIYFPIV